VPGLLDRPQTLEEGVMAADRVPWRHDCGEIAEFPAGVDPNDRGRRCPNCWFTGGSWTPA
jgi:hypothetical protein